MSQSIKPHVEVVESKLFAGAVADEIVATLGEAISERGSASLVLAGGSTPAAVYRALSLPPRGTELPWSKVRIYLGDERWVPKSDGLSNFRMIDETLLQNIRSLSHGTRLENPEVFAVDTELSSPERGAEAYEQSLIKAERLSPGQFPEFDLVLLGMGEDGHTASIFAGGTLASREPFGAEAKKLCLSVQHPHETGKPGGTRVTLTPEALFSARRVMFIVTGAPKSAVVKSALRSEVSPAQLPARLWTKARGSVSWFLDTAASREL